VLTRLRVTSTRQELEAEFATMVWLSTNIERNMIAPKWLKKRKFDAANSSFTRCADIVNFIASETLHAVGSLDCRRFGHHPHPAENYRLRFFADG
jgi:hypothetical protein